MSLINAKGERSTMRVSLYWIIALAAGLTVSLIVAIIIMAVKKTEIDWSGIALCIAAIGVFIAPAFGFKALQTNFENK